MDLTAVLKEIDAWPAEDQAELVQQVWDKLVDSGWTPTLSEELKSELDRRVEDLNSKPDEFLTWEQIVNHVRRRQ